MTGDSRQGFAAEWASRYGRADDPAVAWPGDPAEDGRYSRQVSGLEWVFLGLAPERSTVNLVVEGAGLIDEGLLRDAVAAAAAVHPGARLVREDTRWRDSQVPPRVRVIDPEPFRQGQPSSPELRRGLGDTDPTCEILLAPDHGRAHLVFRAAHAVMDGRGLLLWVEDVFRALRGEQPLGSTETLNCDELLRRICAPDAPPAAAAPPAGEYPSPLGPRSSPSADMFWLRRRVDGTHLGATARVAAAIADRHGSGRFSVPVDLRRHLPGLRSTALLSQPLQLRVDAGQSWETTHQALLTAIADRRELTGGVDPGITGLPLPVLRAGLDDVDRTAAEADRYSERAILSHLGTVDLEALSADGFHAAACYLLGGTNPGSGPELNIVETSGITEVTLAWYQGPGVEERAEALLDTVEEALSPRAHRDWPGNRTDRVLPSHLSVVELFRRQVERTPDRIALDGPEGEVSYAELSRRADAVATELRRRGVGPGSVVGLAAGRTVAAFAGLWGVLRTGACYLPLDVRHPDLRLGRLLQAAGAGCCLLERPQEERDFLPAGCEPVVLDELAGADVPAESADAPIRPDSLAYVIYTSGSTGEPKGVQIEHRNIANYAHWGIRAFGVDAGTRLPLLAALSFDLSKTSVFLPLLVGGQVILMRDEPNHVSLRRLLQDSGANMLSLTPSHLDLIGRLGLNPPPGYRSLVVVGEQLRTEVALRAQQLFGPQCRVINMYGPTEATVGCTSHLFDPVADAAAAAVPIGTPGDNSTVYLLDGDRRFVAPGDVGEMYLGGAQVARGYLGRPDLDRERFPLLADGTRVYRTGDLARLLPSGELEFVGRADDQVKVRGFRVEPAEVARALEQHPGVERAVVLATAPPGSSAKSLYAYAVPRGEVDAEQLERHLGELLPPYMVPSAIVLVPEFAYTVNGKVDRAALPSPFATGTADPAAGSASQAADAVEEAVAKIWAHTLHIDPAALDRQADFHRLGGDSVALLAVLAGIGRELLDGRAEDALLAELPLILREPTLERMAAVVRTIGTRV